MQELRVVGVENGALLVSSVDGERYRLPIDEVLQSKLQQTAPEPGHGKKLAPREIQSYIRSGMSAEDVAEITGVSLDYIRKFEGPVLAEREYIVETALAVPVHTALDTDPIGNGSTFGTVITARLTELGAVGSRWASWKDASAGWIVKLAFSADTIEHDARWSFDPKKHALAPLNTEAITLSQQGESAGALIPRLRAVPVDDRDPDASRFDSGAFAITEARESEEPVDVNPFSARARANDTLPQSSNQTADLLEALRRRRGEREAATFDEDDIAESSPVTGTIRIIDVPLDDLPVEPPAPAAPQRPVATQRTTGQQPSVKGRKGRAAMPSWDEIVFGARPDDLA